MKQLLFLIIAFSSLTLYSQQIEVASFTAQTDNKNVYLNWLLAGGATCNGIKIFRGYDTINFVEVGDIAGVCGSSSKPVGYDFTDEFPVYDQKMYYKLRLGYSQFSEIRQVLIETNINRSVLIKPNPAKDQVTIEFDNSTNTAFSFNLYNANGHLIFSQERVLDQSITLDISAFSEGLYSFIIANGKDKKFNGSLIITK